MGDKKESPGLENSVRKGERENDEEESRKTLRFSEPQSLGADYRAPATGSCTGTLAQEQWHRHSSR